MSFMAVFVIGLAPVLVFAGVILIVFAFSATASL